MREVKGNYIFLSSAFRDNMCMGLGPDWLGSHPRSAAYRLCDLEQDARSLWAFTFQMRNNNRHLEGLLWRSTQKLYGAQCMARSRRSAQCMTHSRRLANIGYFSPTPGSLSLPQSHHPVSPLTELQFPLRIDQGTRPCQEE